jgi:hypothetical protein
MLRRVEPYVAYGYVISTYMFVLVHSFKILCLY